MEGDKGGEAKGLSYTGKRSIAERWDDYKKLRARHGLPVIGSRELFKKIWVAHTEIREYSAKTHPKCDDCGKF
eukprot:1516517-Pleurochrysis_carterae.AAC.1